MQENARSQREVERNQQPTNQGEQANPVAENIQTVAHLHKRLNEKASPQQLAIERVTNFLGRPRFLFLTLLITTLWILANILLNFLHVPPFDSPPFAWLQGVLTLAAVLMDTVILITQNRQEQVTERNRQLDIQTSLLIDQKISKLIEMMDAHTKGQSHNGTSDPQVEAMKEPIDPHDVLSSLDELLEEDKKMKKEGI
jgi:uncharacterized membrane protein